MDPTSETVVLTIWKMGKVHREIKLGQVLSSLQSLGRGASHYCWLAEGEMGFGDDGWFWIDTIERKWVRINPEEGKIEFTSAHALPRSVRR